MIIVLSLIVGLYFVRLARGKINNVFQVCQVVIFAICIITMSACNIYGVFDHKNMYYMDDGYRECKIVCVKSNCADLFYAPYWGKQLKGWISNGKT